MPKAIFDLFENDGGLVEYRLDGLACVVAVATPTTQLTPLWPQEQASIAHAGRKRQGEFQLGRHCARAAIEHLGFAPSAILIGPKDAPLWPDGVVASLSHSRGYGLAIASQESGLYAIGVDIEPQSRAIKDDLRRMFLSASEQARLGQLPTDMLFSLKEAAYKCFGDAPFLRSIEMSGQRPPFVGHFEGRQAICHYFKCATWRLALAFAVGDHQGSGVAGASGHDHKSQD